MRSPWVIFLLVALIGGCDGLMHAPYCDDVGGCQPRLDAGHDAASMDASAPDVGHDANDIEDAVVCPTTQTFDCTGPEQCISWMTSLAPAGTTAHSVCGRLRVCQIGDAACFSVGDGFQCRCSDTLTCMPGELCVSDTPDGPTRCVAVPCADP